MRTPQPQETPRPEPPPRSAQARRLGEAHCISDARRLGEAHCIGDARRLGEAQWLRVAVLSIACMIAGAVVVTDLFAAGGPATVLGTPGVALGADTARSVERGHLPPGCGTHRRCACRRRPTSGADHRRSHRGRSGRSSTGCGRLTSGPSSPSCPWWRRPSAAWSAWCIPRPPGDGSSASTSPIWAIPELVRETIVHELSHVVTLAPEVFTFGEVDRCAGTEISLGCAAAGSVLAAYADAFWPGDVASPRSADFVNEYASTSAHEDLAETFTAWGAGVAGRGRGDRREDRHARGRSGSGPTRRFASSVAPTRKRRATPRPSRLRHR